MSTTVKQRDKSEPKECPGDCLIAKTVAGLSVGLVLANPSGNVVWMNRAAERVVGARMSECVGRPVPEIMKDPQAAAFWHDATENGGSHTADVSVRYPSEMELKVSVTKCMDEDGEDLGCGLLLCDVTAERKVQVELSQAVAHRLLDLTSGHMPPEPVAHLTAQELRVLRLVGRGMGNDEIAENAGISPSTVRSHLKNLYRKLGLESRTAAVSYAVRNHLV